MTRTVYSHLIHGYFEKDRLLFSFLLTSEVHVLVCGNGPCHFFGTMQRNTTKFGVVVAANSSCLYLDLDLCSYFSFSVVSV